MFVEVMLSAEPGQMLKLQEAHTFFRELLKQKNLPDLTKAYFKSYIDPLIRQNLNVALRNDLCADGKSIRGWKGLRLLRTMSG